MSSLFGSARHSRIFKDHTALSFDYIPKSLPHREAQLKKLASLFDPVLESDLSQTAFVTGGVGTGKTVVTKYFCQELRAHGAGMNRQVDYVHINCRQRQTESMVMLGVMQHFDPNFPDRGYSLTEMMQVLKGKMASVGGHLLVILDEADSLIKRSGSDLIYMLTRFNEETQKHKGALSLILISQKYVLDQLDQAALSTFRRSNVVEFDRYDTDQLEAILSDRVPLAFRDGGVEDGVLSMIAEMAKEYGDARFAIELLDHAGRIAEEEGADSVGPEHARGAKAAIKPFITTDRLEGLDLHKSMLLMALARSVRNKAYAETKKIEDAYRLLCEEVGEKPKGHTQVWNYLTDLEAQGLISKRLNYKGASGTSAMITLTDCTSQEILKALEPKVYK